MMREIWASLRLLRKETLGVSRRLIERELKHGDVEIRNIENGSID